MDGLRDGGLGLVSRGLLFGLVGGLAYGCEASEIASQCGLDVECKAGGFAEGKASISGVAAIDAFFGAAIDLHAAMTDLDASLRAELDAIGASVGLEPGASGAELKLAVDEHLALFVDGGLELRYQPAKCEASVEATVSAAAECDVDVEPGEVSAKCSGSCKAEVEAGASCSGDAQLVCSGTAPQLRCSGTCSGTCVAQLETAASCEGTCRGSCETELGLLEGFEGRCDGDCQGECAVDVSAGGSCEGQCEGTCEYEAPEGGCEAGATARCEAAAGASIECDGGCEGTVEPPQVSAECEATVEAKASASVQCSPPTIDVGFRWATGVETDADAQAEFRAWLEGFRAHFGAILAARARAEVVADAAGSLVATISEDGALTAAVDDLVVEGSLKDSVGAGCAAKELPVAFEALGSASTDLGASLSASAELVTAFGG